jgi:hypothetical protein
VKLKYDETLLNFAFRFSFDHYLTGVDREKAPGMEGQIQQNVAGPLQSAQPA